MSAKYTLQIEQPDPPVSKLPVTETSPARTGWETPIGWWTVTTEGDAEGRTTQGLGTYYGHYAEVALHLAVKACYTLTLTPELDRPRGLRDSYKATAAEVWVELNSPTARIFGSHSAKVHLLSEWLNTEDLHILPRLRDCAYYNAAVLRLLPERF